MNERLQGSPFRGYAYSYPHKSAYRPLTPPRPLREVWAGEDRSALHLYLHIPFCEMRCGFCNLFTRPMPPEAQVNAYLDTLERQAEAVATALGEARFARLSLGGGTPTFLRSQELERLLGILRDGLGATPTATPTSVETSPATATPERLEVLRHHGVERISMGVQSLLPDELRDLSRPEAPERAREAMERLAGAGFPVVNLDLIYGIPGQDVASFLETLDEVLGHRPDELYLYPLYVRPLTGMGRREAEATDLREELYQAGRRRLLESGFRQVSMRFFQRIGIRGTGPEGEPTELREYRCQEDGMVGLGCGARSYTRRLHYSSDYAVSHRGVRGILESWIESGPEALSHAHYGVEVSPGEARRRFVIQGLLRLPGLHLPSYRERFGGNAEEHLPELSELRDSGLAVSCGDFLSLTPEGLLRSDLVGPFLYSPEVRRRMEDFDLR